MSSHPPVIVLNVRCFLLVVRALWGGLAAEQRVSHILEKLMLSFTFVVVNAHCRDDGLESTGLYGKVMTAVIEFISAGGDT